MPASRGYGYLSLDDDVVRAGAEMDPMGFIDDLPEHVVLDEVQRAPGIFTALKLSVDRRRTPGRFVLTGSFNLLAVPTVQDSLAGRLETVRLHPLSQCEVHAKPTCRRLASSPLCLKMTSRFSRPRG